VVFRSRPRILALCVLLAAIVLALLAAAMACDCLGSSRAFPRRAENVLYAFLDGEQPSSTAYDALAGYFVKGFMTYRSPDGAYARYPGWPMGEGGPEDQHQDRLEGFSRIAPLLASWLHGGRPQLMSLPSGGTVDAADLLRTGFLAGTDPESGAYWGAIGDHDSRIVEAHDIALALWLSRRWTWDQFSDAEREQVSAWLQGASGRRTVDNNWHLFIVLTDLVLQNLGVPTDRLEIERRYSRFKSFYAGDGWFRDGPGGPIDYYNAWGIHYSLFWIGQLDPTLDPGFLNDTLTAFAKSLKHLIGPHAFPIMGRSVCYRMAVPAPVIMAHIADLPTVTAGEARRALDLTWRHFIRNGAVQRGTVTQGYCGADPRWLDGYSGPASCLWSLRSLVAAFYLPSESAFWNSEGHPLPVEKGDFNLTLTAIDRRIVGEAATGEVRLEMLSTTPAATPKVESYSLFRRVTDALLCRSRRPSNTGPKYDLPEYSSRSPFCDCVASGLDEPR